MLKTDIVIIGAGIAGISAAIYLKRVNSDFLLIEENEIGGKLNQINNIGNFPSLKKETGSSIKEKLKEQIEALKINVTKASVQTILKENSGFRVVTNINMIDCNKVILAIGNGTESKLIPGEAKYIGQGVSYCAVCDGNFFKGSDVAVIGNNDVALEEAIYLSNLVNKLYFFAPEKLSGHINLIETLKNKSNIVIFENRKVDEIIGDDFGVTGIISNGEKLDIYGVFSYVGHKNATQILNNLNPKMNGSNVICDENMMSNIDGLFCAGDIVDKKLKQLITAASDGAVAAVFASNKNI